MVSKTMHRVMAKRAIAKAAMRKAGVITITDPSCVQKFASYFGMDEILQAVREGGLWHRHEDMNSITQRVIYLGDTVAGRVYCAVDEIDPGNEHKYWNNIQNETGKQIPLNEPTTFYYEPEAGASTEHWFGEVLVYGHMYGNFKVLHWVDGRLVNSEVSKLSVSNPTEEAQRFFTALFCNDMGESNDDEIVRCIEEMDTEDFPIECLFKVGRLSDGGSKYIKLVPTKEDMEWAEIGEDWLTDNVGAFNRYNWEQVFFQDYIMECLGECKVRFPNLVAFAQIDFSHPSVMTSKRNRELPTEGVLTPREFVEGINAAVEAGEELGDGIIEKSIGGNMETPAIVIQSQNILKAWNAFRKVAENGVTNETQFTMEGAENMTDEAPKDIAVPDANDLVDEEAGEQVEGNSAFDETGLAAENAEADEDMTVDSADAVESVKLSMSHLAKSLMRKFDEANPDATGEEREEVKESIEEDLQDPEATEEIAESMEDTDEKLADELHDHADKIECAKKALFKSMFKKEDVGATALSEEEVGVGTESAEDITGDANDSEMPESAVDAAGTDKIDASGDLEDPEDAPVADEDEKENPGYPLPEDDTAEPETVSVKESAKKALEPQTMSITDMIAAKRGQRIDTAESETDAGYHPTAPNGYRTVRMGDGKTMMPPFKH